MTGIAVYVETPNEETGRIKPEDYAALQENIGLLKSLGAKVVKLKSPSCGRCVDRFRETGRHHACCFWPNVTVALGHSAARLNHQSFSA